MSVALLRLVVFIQTTVGFRLLVASPQTPLLRAGMSMASGRDMALLPVPRGLDLPVHFMIAFVRSPLEVASTILARHKAQGLGIWSATDVISDSKLGTRARRSLLKCLDQDCGSSRRTCPATVPPGSAGRAHHRTSNIRSNRLSSASTARRTSRRHRGTGRRPWASCLSSDDRTRDT
jgi:hypothetical protein